MMTMTRDLTGNRWYDYERITVYDVCGHKVIVHQLCYIDDIGEVVDDEWIEI